MPDVYSAGRAKKARSYDRASCLMFFFCLLFLLYVHLDCGRPALAADADQVGTAKHIVQLEADAASGAGFHNRVAHDVKHFNLEGAAVGAVDAEGVVLAADGVACTGCLGLSDGCCFAVGAFVR